MLRKLTFSDDKVLAFRWEGEFNKEAFDQAMNEFLPEFKTRDRFDIYLELLDISGVESKAVWDDLKFYSGNAKELVKKIDKVALVTDNSWIKNIAETSYKLVPGIELKSFKLDESDVARQWVIK